MKCRNCKKNKFKKIINLGSQPISSVFFNKKKYNLKKYPLNLYECTKCKLIQFSRLAPLEDMYGSTYGYRTSLSNLMINHMKKKFNEVKKMKILKINSNILDIGSNDGTFLNFFGKSKKKLNLFAIDPSAEKFKSFYNKNINLIVDFFSKKKIDNFFHNEKESQKKFSLITSYAMFYDLEDPNSFCRDINKILSPSGLWISEFSYFPLLLKNLTYDQICHEHVTYYTLNTFNNIIKKNGLRIIDISFNEINGGSIEVICAKKVSKFLRNEKKIAKTLADEKLINFESYKRFNERVNNTKKVIQLFLKKSKNNIIGYGASTKGNIVLNHCKLTEKNLPYICDANPYKFGRYTPGSNIKIISKKMMRKIQPDYLFVLIWSFRSEVIKQELNYIKKGGKLIFHLPIFHIIDKKNYKKYLKEDFKTFSYNY
jgi:NDP-4-keto-2,6-dideoxyhexose 3-C-methyltransferase|tara:strand:+ start:98 stop:1378 length:1281 start_codon:yes stop_codon:yes gene_type:complete